MPETRKRRTRLLVKSIRSIGFVDRGACEDANIVIAKRAAEEPMKRYTAKAEGDAPAGGESVPASTPASEGLPKKECPECKGEMVPDPEGGWMCPVCGTKESGEEKPAESAPAPSEGEAGKRSTCPRCVHLEAQVQTLTAKAANTNEAWKIGLPVEVRKHIESVEAQATQALKMANAERETRMRLEFVDIAKGYSHLSIEPQQLGDVLMQAAGTLQPKQYAELLRVLGAADAAGKALFAERGVTGATTNDASAIGTINAKCQTLVQDGKASTFAEALAVAKREDPELWRGYLRESRVRV